MSPPAPRTWRGYAVVALPGATVYLLSMALMRGGYEKPILLLGGLVAGLGATAVLHAILVALWERLRRGALRLIATLLASWLVFASVVTAFFAAGGDPVRAERVAERGWLGWIAVDIVLRGLVLGATMGIVLVWLWAPLGALWYFALRRVVFAPRDRPR